MGWLLCLRVFFFFGDKQEARKSKGDGHYRKNGIGHGHGQFHPAIRPLSHSPYPYACLVLAFFFVLFLLSSLIFVAPDWLGHRPPPLHLTPSPPPAPPPSTSSLLHHWQKLAELDVSYSNSNSNFHLIFLLPPPIATFLVHFLATTSRFPRRYRRRRHRILQISIGSL